MHFVQGLLGILFILIFVLLVLDKFILKNDVPYILTAIAGIYFGTSVGLSAIGKSDDQSQAGNGGHT